MKYRLVFTASLLVCGCTHEHKLTSSFCNKELYVETFTTSPFYDVDYLTDSLNFRLKVGAWEKEHQNFIYKCNGDKISIFKVELGSKNCRWATLPDGTETVKCDVDTIERKTYSLESLRKNRVNDQWQKD